MERLNHRAIEVGKDFFQKRVVIEDKYAKVKKIDRTSNVFLLIHLAVMLSGVLLLPYLLGFALLAVSVLMFFNKKSVLKGSGSKKYNYYSYVFGENYKEAESYTLIPQGSELVSLKVSIDNTTRQVTPFKDYFDNKVSSMFPAQENMRIVNNILKSKEYLIVFVGGKHYLVKVSDVQELFYCIYLKDVDLSVENIKTVEPGMAGKAKNV